MDLEKIIANKKRGDIAQVADILGINQSNAGMALRNPDHKRHDDVTKGIVLLIETRNVLKEALK